MMAKRRNQNISQATIDKLSKLAGKDKKPVDDHGDPFLSDKPVKPVSKISHHKGLSLPLESSVVLTEFCPIKGRFVNVPIFSQLDEPTYGTIIIRKDGYYFEFDPENYTDCDFSGIYMGHHRILSIGSFPQSEVKKFLRLAKEKFGLLPDIKITCKANEKDYRDENYRDDSYAANDDADEYTGPYKS